MFLTQPEFVGDPINNVRHALLSTGCNSKDGQHEGLVVGDARVAEAAKMIDGVGILLCQGRKDFAAGQSTENSRQMDDELNLS